MLGNEEDFSAALGFDVDALDLDAEQFKKMIGKCGRKSFRSPVVATTLRKATTATPQRLGSNLFLRTAAFHEAQPRKDLEIYDRVGGGDSFASGLIYGLLAGSDRAMGRRVRRGAWSAGDDHSRRYDHGDSRRSAAGLSVKERATTR